jgi:hypothetical protein
VYPNRLRSLTRMRVAGRRPLVARSESKGQARIAPNSRANLWSSHTTNPTSVEPKGRDDDLDRKQHHNKLNRVHRPAAPMKGSTRIIPNRSGASTPWSRNLSPPIRIVSASVTLAVPVNVCAYAQAQHATAIATMLVRIIARILSFIRTSRCQRAVERPAALTQ